MRDEEWDALTVAEVATLSSEAERDRLRAIARLRQRKRRACLMRIDYYPSPRAARAIAAALDTAGASYGGFLDEQVERWADESGIE